MQQINIEIYQKNKKKKKKEKRDYRRNRYHNISEEKEQKLKEYQKKYCEIKNSQSNN